MRKLLALGGAVVVGALVVGSGGVALAERSATVPTKKPPVTLSGKVTNKGTKSAKSNKITLEQDDLYFSPTFIKAKPGTTLTVALKNEGKSQHTFTIDALNVDKVLNPDEKATVQVTVPASGALNFYCRFHRASGMQGAVFTKTGDTVVGSSTASSAGGSSSSSSSSSSTSTTSSSSGGSGY